MNTRACTTFQSTKAPVKNEKKEKLVMQSSTLIDAKKATTSQKGSVSERKMALEKDVDKLKKKLKQEENVHRALERAFTRPLGSLPRLPPYLPSSTSELLAEVAVLEEEIVRLEEQIVHFRQGLYQEAVYTSSSKRNMENSADVYGSSHIKDEQQKNHRVSIQTDTSPTISVTMHLSALPACGCGKENHSCISSTKDKRQSPNVRVQPIRIPVKKPLIEYRSPEKQLTPRKLQLESRGLNSEYEKRRTSINQDERLSPNESPNEISENILKCLLRIFLRMGSKRTNGSQMLSSLPSFVVCEGSAETEFKDPYGICLEFGKRDVGPYKHLIEIDAPSINPNQTTIFALVNRLKLLFEKLTAVNLQGLSHQEKLAFWINTYNSCMMNAFLDSGIPENPETVVALMQKATINVGGHLLNALKIEHFILRLPYHSKYNFAKGAKNDEMAVRTIFGLELSEPLVTFALSCGSWSSPAVRVYTASQVESELEAAKREYLQAAVGVSTMKKLVGIPKLLDWYLLDFAKDMESLLDWICLQLPTELGKEALKCLDRGKGEPLSRIIQYDFSFRYLIHI